MKNELILHDYQENGSLEVAKKLSSGKRRVIFQLATGGGKTVVFCTITKRFITKSKRPVLILVHREELLHQTRKTLYNWYGIVAQPISADTKNVPMADVYVGMVETVSRRLTKLSRHISEVGLLIVDECHLGNFTKIYQHFEHSFILGFSATPLAAKKTDPLKNHFDDIVCGIDVPELIERGNLTQNVTYRPKFSVNTSNFHVGRSGDFDEQEMATEFSKSKHVKNAVEQYKKFSDNTKAVFFNCNISHSKLVTQALLEAGYNARHLDGEHETSYRKECLEWLKNTPDAILCNVGILTTGFDEPSIQTVVMNRATLSLPLWLQCTGRGGRVYTGKEKFTIIDLGANTLLHGDWSDERDWSDLFFNPPKKSDKKGVAPVKDCPSCEATIAVSSMVCKYCDYEFPVNEVVYDSTEIEMVLHVKPIQDLVESNEGKKEYYTFFQIGNSIATQVRYRAPIMSDTTAEGLLKQYHLHIQEWCAIKNKKFNSFHKKLAKEHLYSSLQKYFPKWQPQA